MTKDIWQACCKYEDNDRDVPQPLCIDKPFVYNGYRYATNGVIAIRKKWRAGAKDTQPPKGKHFPNARIECYFRQKAECPEPFPKSIPQIRSSNSAMNAKLKEHECIQLQGFVIRDSVLRLINRFQYPKYLPPYFPSSSVRFVADGGIEGIVMPVDLG